MAQKQRREKLRKVCEATFERFTVDTAAKTGQGVVRLACRHGHSSLVGMITSPNLYCGFRFPAEIIEHAVWLYHCFSLSLRDVETILAARGIVGSYESIRDRGLRFGRL